MTSEKKGVFAVQSSSISPSIYVLMMFYQCRFIAPCKMFFISAPNTPLTKTSKACLDCTPVPQIQSLVWKTGVPTPSLDGTLTPNQEAINLLAGFAMGSVMMEGDIVQHLPATQGNKAIGESLSELPWYSPDPTKKTGGSAICSKRAMLAVKAPKKCKNTQTQAGLMATQHPCQRVPNSEIRIENIIPGSPEYIPYKRIKNGKKGGKNLVAVSVGMTKSKQTPTKAQMAKAQKELKLAKDAKEKEWQTKGGGKDP